LNKERPFADMLRMVLLSDNRRRLRAIVDKLADKAEQGDMQAIKEVADRSDGKAVQAIERSDDRVEMLSDAELLMIAAGGLSDALQGATYPKLCAPVGD
jgi:hypothetical protein